MRAFDKLRVRVRSLLLRGRVEHELDGELRFHLEQEIDERVRAGMSRAEATLAARRTFGSVSHVEDECRDALGLRLLDSFRQDVRYAVRSFARAPGFTIVAVLTLALGIGANAAIFGIINAVLLKPLPYADPDRLVMVWSNNTNEGRTRNTMSPADFVDLRAGSRTLGRVEALQAMLIPSRLTARAGPVPAVVAASTAGMFQLLGREALVGRTLRTDEESGAIVLSHGYWQRVFGGDRTAVGTVVTLDNQAVTIVGVMPADFAFPYLAMLGPTGFTTSTDVDIWTGLPFEGSRFRDADRSPIRGVRFLGLIGRMNPGATVEAVQAEMIGLTRQLALAYPDADGGWSATVVPVHEQVVGPMRSTLTLLWAAVGVVLLIACVNVGNLLLTRSVGRQREMAMRVALGAGRERLLRQTLTEMVVLATAGAALALLFVQGSMRLFVALAPGEIPRLHEISLDWRVLIFTFVVALGSAVLTGLIPAFAATRAHGPIGLNDGARGTSGAGPRRVRATLVTLEMALAVVLTIGAGLLLHSFVTVLNVDPGFQAENLLTLQMNVPTRYDTAEKRRVFYRDFFMRMEAIPGVARVGGTTRLPLGSTNVTSAIVIEGRALPTGQLPEVEFRRALRDYFSAMAIPVLRGRGFDERDNPAAPRVVVINQTMAQRFFPRLDPIGKRIRIGASPSAPWSTIIGVIGDVRHQGLEMTPAPEVYIYYLQNPPVSPFIVIRSTGEAGALASRVRLAALDVDPELTLFDLRTMSDVRSESVSPRRFVMLLVVAFGALAVILAMLGVYSVMALVVTERTQEIAIRLALGAEPTTVLGLVARQGAALAGLGIAAGVGAAIALTPLMRQQLYGVDAGDPVTFVAVPALLLVVALLACVLPARRVLRVDPIAALRCD